MASFDREEQLRRLHEKRKQETKEKVEEAGVSKATLYNHTELKER